MSDIKRASDGGDHPSLDDFSRPSPSAKASSTAGAHDAYDYDDEDAPNSSTKVPGSPPPPELPLHDRAQVPDAEGSSAARDESAAGRGRRVATFAKRHVAFLGPGLIASVAYFDPGNWATDLSAGTKYRYSHLFVVLLSGLMAILLQILACRLGIVTKHDLAEQCRIALHNRPKNKMLWRWGVLYPLYFLSESAIIFTDLAELIGSAIAINLLIPQIPLYAGVLLTGADVLIILAFFNSYPSKTVNRSVRLFEGVIGLLVIIVLACFIVLLARVGPDWSDVFRGYVPSSGIINDGGLYVAVGIVGATVMPHAIFLGSKLATIKRLADDDASLSHYNDPAKATSDRHDSGLQARRPSAPGPSLHMPHPVAIPRSLSHRGLDDQPESSSAKSKSNGYTKVNVANVPFINAHVKHASIDIGLSLFCFALVINSAILILAGTAFHNTALGSDADIEDGDLFAAHELIKVRVGAAPAFLFALALLLSGQAASITATLAGQVVSEGFINWRTTPWVRRLVTRLIGIIPSVTVAVAVGRSGLDTLLVASQVALSIVLPFVIFPLLWFTSDQRLMVVAHDDISAAAANLSALSPATSPTDPSLTGTSTGILPTSSATPQPTQRLTASQRVVQTARTLNPIRRRKAVGPGLESYANPMIVIWFGAGIFTLVCIANVYALVQLGNGSA